MEESDFDELAARELDQIETAFEDVDPDEVELSSSAGVITFELKNGVKVVLNSHRAARQIWLAAVASAWHFDPSQDDGKWYDSKTNAELRTTLKDVIKEQIGLNVAV